MSRTDHPSDTSYFESKNDRRFRLRVDNRTIVDRSSGGIIVCLVFSFSSLPFPFLPRSLFTSLDSFPVRRRPLWRSPTVATVIIPLKGPDKGLLIQGTVTGTDVPETRSRAESVRFGGEKRKTVSRRAKQLFRHQSVSLSSFPFVRAIRRRPREERTSRAVFRTATFRRVGLGKIREFPWGGNR